MNTLKTPSLAPKVTLNCIHPSAGQLPFPDIGELQNPTSFPQIQGPFSFFNNPLEIRTQVSCLAQPCMRDPASVLHPWGRQVSGLLALEGGSIVSPCRLRLSEGARPGPRVQLPGLPSRNHSPLADTASLRTSLFLSSRGLAKARITWDLYGSSTGVGRRVRACIHCRAAIRTAIEGLELRVRNLVTRVST